MSCGDHVLVHLLFLFLLICSTLSKPLDTEQVQQQIGTVIYGVDLEPFHRVVERKADQAFRLSIYYDRSVGTGLSNEIKIRIENVILPQLKDFFESLLMVRPTMVPILLQRDCTGGRYYPTNINNTRQCATTCKGMTMCGQAAVPPEHLKQCIQCNGNGNACGPTGSGGTGVINTDFILYVSAVATSACVAGRDNTMTVAYATTCQMESGLDRPIAGSVNFCPPSFSGATDDFIVSVAKHELIHALGFSTSLYPFWRDQYGKPRTPREGDGFPPRDSRYRFTWSTTTILQVKYTDWQVYSGKTTHDVNIMVTPNVIAEGRRHFGCPTLQGVELENQGGEGTEMSHWEKRILGNELMTGLLDSNTALSRITLALMEDSGWYKVNYKYSQYLAWGNNAGCTLSTKSCLQYMNERTRGGQSIVPFCNKFSSSSMYYGCTADRKYKSTCNLATYTNSLPQEYIYFENPAVGGGTVIADFCPYETSFNYVNGKTTQCSDASNQPADNQDFSAETYGNESKCFNHANQWTLGINKGPLIDSGCYKYSCNSDSSVITIYVRGTPYVCNRPGQIFTISVPSNGFGQYKGNMKCPSSFATVCKKEVLMIPTHHQEAIVHD